jgi:hypothetical protein
MRVHCMSKGNCYIPDHDSNSSESPKHILSECIEGAIVADSCLEIRTIFGRQSRIEGRKEPSERSVVSHCTSLQKINPFRIQHTFEVQERVDCPSYPSRRYLLLSPVADPTSPSIAVPGSNNHHSITAISSSLPRLFLPAILTSHQLCRESIPRLLEE